KQSGTTTFRSRSFSPRSRHRVDDRSPLVLSSGDTVTPRAVLLRVVSCVLACWILAGSAAAQNVTVTTADPNTGAQGTTSLVVKISGRNFAPGARADFFLSGTSNPAGITVHGTQWVSASEVDATIDIADTAALAFFDIRVANTNGRSGKGSDLFNVVQKAASNSCTREPLDARLGLEQEFNPTGLYQGLGPSSLMGRMVVGAA